MNLFLAAGAIVGMCVAVAFVILFRRLVCYERFTNFSAEWLSEYSVNKYQPMQRLLSEDDYRFLASQKGVDGRMIRRLRSERRKIFREYLHLLKRDFSRLEAAVRLFAAHSAEDRPDLAKALLRQRWMFTRAVLAAECRLVLHGLGVGTVDVRGLVGSLDAMRIQLGQFAVARQASLA